MSRTASNMIPLGVKAPEFTLYDTVSGNDLSLLNHKGDLGTVIFLFVIIALL